MRRLALLLGLGVWLGTSCVPATGYYDYSYAYDYTYYDPYYYYYDAAYTYYWVDPYYDYFLVYSAPGTDQQAAVDLNALAARIAAEAPGRLTPANCASATSSGATVTLNLANCTGPMDLRAVSGTITLNLAMNGNQFAFSATSSNLTVDNEAYNLDLNGTVSGSGTQRSVTLTSRSRSPARLDSRHAQATITWEKGSNCFTIDGQSQIAKGNQSATTTLSSFKRCKGQCPSSGTVSVATANTTFSGTFNGSSTLTVTGSGGQSRNIDLHCP